MHYKAKQVEAMRYLTALLATIFSAASLGQELSFREGDPFVFCTEGMRIPAPCWKPVKPYTGQFIYTGACHPNPYGRPWTAADTQALQELISICPQAQESGGWDGKGPANMSPHLH